MYYLSLLAISFLSLLSFEAMNLARGLSCKSALLEKTFAQATRSLHTDSLTPPVLPLRLPLCPKMALIRSDSHWFHGHFLPSPKAIVRLPKLVKMTKLP